MTAFPFGTKVYKVDVNPKILMEVLEWSVHDRINQNTTSHGGGFLQYSGIHVYLSLIFTYLYLLKSNKLLIQYYQGYTLI
jgi:hypothetical protein